MGIDIKLDVNDDIRFTGRDDFLTVSSYDNLKQAISVRLRTKLASMVLHPNYGSDLPYKIGDLGNVGLLSNIRQIVRKTLLQEPRIKIIKFISVFYTNPTDFTNISVEIKLIPIDSDIELNLIYPDLLNLILYHYLLESI